MITQRNGKIVEETGSGLSSHYLQLAAMAFSGPWVLLAALVGALCS